MMRAVWGPNWETKQLIVTAFQRAQSKKGFLKSNFTVKKPDKHYLSLLIKVNINSVSHNDKTYLWYEVIKITCCLSFLLSKTHNPSLIMKKN